MALGRFDMETAFAFDPEGTAQSLADLLVHGTINRLHARQDDARLAHRRKRAFVERDRERQRGRVFKDSRRPPPQ